MMIVRFTFDELDEPQLSPSLWLMQASQDVPLLFDFSDIDINAYITVRHVLRNLR